MSIDIWYEWHGICVRPCWKAGLDKGKTRGRCAAPALMGPGVGERKGAEMQILGRTGRFQNLELTCQCICAFVHLCICTCSGSSVNQRDGWSSRLLVLTSTV